MSNVDQGLTASLTAVLVSTIALLAGGQVLFKRAANVIDFSRPTTLLTPQLIVALAVYAVATVLWLYVLGKVRLSVAFPFYGLSFVFVPLLAWWLLHEPIGWRTIAGSGLIIAGVVLASSGGRGAA